MNKTLIAALALTFITWGCGQKKPTGTATAIENDNEELLEKTDADNDAVSDEESVNTTPTTYLSQDLATFDLFGKVLSVSYAANAEISATITFDADGTLKDFSQPDGGGDKEQASIIRDNRGRIEEIAFESEDPWLTMFSYAEEDGFLPPASYINTNTMGNFIIEKYHWQTAPHTVSVETEEYVHFGKLEDTPERVINLSDFDSHGNWQTCINKDADYTLTIKRTINYHQ